jgi:DNA-binding beta-propeller fold protein YncE
MGFFVRSAELRPVLGLPLYGGAGSRLQLPAGTARLVLSPAHDYALAANAEGRWSLLLLNEAGTTGSRAFDAAPESADSVAISPGGQAVVFYAGGKVHVLTGMPGAPRIAFTADAVEPGMQVISLGVNDAGESALVGLSDGNAGSVLEVSAKAGSSRVMQAGNPAAIRFAANAERAYVADRTLNQIVSVNLRSGAAEILASQQHGLNAPMDIEIDTAAGRLLVANSGTNAVLELSLEGAVLGSIDCGFAPGRIRALRQQRVFSISSRDDESFWLLSTNGLRSRLTYLPVVD